MAGSSVFPFHSIWGEILEYLTTVVTFSLVFIAGLFVGKTLWKRSDCYPSFTRLEERAVQAGLEFFSSLLWCWSSFDRILSISWHYFTPPRGFVLLTIPFWPVQGGTEELITGWLLPVAKSIKLLIWSSSHMFNSGFIHASLIDLIAFGILSVLYQPKLTISGEPLASHGAGTAQGSIFGVHSSSSAQAVLCCSFGSGPDCLPAVALAQKGSIVLLLCW